MDESAETISITGFLLMPWYGLFLTVKAKIFLATTIHKYSYIGCWKSWININNKKNDKNIST